MSEFCPSTTYPWLVSVPTRLDYCNGFAAGIASHESLLQRVWRAETQFVMNLYGTKRARVTARVSSINASVPQRYMQQQYVTAHLHCRRTTSRRKTRILHREKNWPASCVVNTTDYDCEQQVPSVALFTAATNTCGGTTACQFKNLPYSIDNWIRFLSTENN